MTPLLCVLSCSTTFSIACALRMQLACRPFSGCLSRCYTQKGKVILPAFLMWVRECVSVLSRGCVRNLPEQDGIDVRYVSSKDKRLLRPVLPGVFRSQLSVFDLFSVARLRWMQWGLFVGAFDLPPEKTEAVSHCETNPKRSWRSRRQDRKSVV